MKKNFFTFIFLGTLVFTNVVAAESSGNTQPAQNLKAAPAGLTPSTIPTGNALFPVNGAPRSLVTPPPPAINATGYILQDADSGVTLASSNPDKRLAPASLTKIMTSYIVAAAVKAGRIHPDDPVTISEKAWRMGGSKTFIKIGSIVSVKDLLQGIIVQSGNDACVAMAECVAGSEDAFVNLMNQQAAILGMKNTHFTDSTGMPDPNHYTTPRDMAVLSRALIRDFPEDYKWYSQKWYVYNNIRQPNRNRLLWRDSSVDGIKTGHTDDAGFCLVASAKRNNMRLVSVVMGSPSDNQRANDSQELLNYGFRFFETHKLYDAGKPINYARVWFGKSKKIPIGMSYDLSVTVPVGQFNQVKTEKTFDMNLKAPVQKGQVVGTISFLLNNKVLLKEPLSALQEDPKSGFFRQLSEYIRLGLYRLLGAGGPTA